MNTIPFPKSDIEKIRKGKKNVTLRVKSEQGKYQAGQELQVTTYNGDPAGLTIRIVIVQSTIVASLSGFNIPRKGIKELMSSTSDIFDQTRVDIVRFEIITQ